MIIRKGRQGLEFGARKGYPDVRAGLSQEQTLAFTAPSTGAGSGDGGLRGLKVNKVRDPQRAPSGAVHDWAEGKGSQGSKIKLGVTMGVAVDALQYKP